MICYSSCFPGKLGSAPKTGGQKFFEPLIKELLEHLSRYLPQSAGFLVTSDFSGSFLCCYDKGVSERERGDAWTEPPSPSVEICSPHLTLLFTSLLAPSDIYDMYISHLINDSKFYNLIISKDR